MSDDECLRKDSISARAFDRRAADDPPARARAVVIGGGIIGCSVAFHLAALGWTDTVVLERHSVASGTSWHAAGLVTRTRPTHVQTELASYSRDFYKGLAQRTGIDVGYYESGSISLAQTPERMVELDYVHSMARHHDLPVERLDPAEVAAAVPVLETGDLVGGLLFHGDATVNPGVAAFATAEAAFDLGVRIVEGVRVTGFRLSGGRVTGVQTDRGLVECEVAVIAAGLWSRDLGLMAGAHVPLQAVQHAWVQTAAVAGVTRDLPIVRDLDGHFYARHYRGGLVIGAFAPGAKARRTSSIPPDFAFGEFEPDRAHMDQPLAAARRRIPAARDVAVEHSLNAPESFTPDAVFLMGETARLWPNG
jgi:4-methylaminobutanoate oxidase (formaldehyde-forming)